MIFSGVDVTHDGKSAKKREISHSDKSLPRNLYRTELLVFNKSNKDVSNIFVIPVIKAPFSNKKDRIGTYAIHQQDIDTSWHIRAPLSFPDVHRGTALSKRVNLWSHEYLYIGAVCLFDQNGQRTDHFPIIQNFTFPADHLNQLFVMRPQPRPAVPEAELEALECSAKLPFRRKFVQSNGQDVVCTL